MSQKCNELSQRCNELSESNKVLQDQNNVYKQKSTEDKKTIESLMKQLAEYKNKSDNISPPRKNLKLVDSSEKLKTSTPTMEVIPGSNNPIPKFSSKPGAKPTPMGKNDKSGRNSSKQGSR